MYHGHVAHQMSKPARDLLLEHIDGTSYVAAPFSVQDPARKRTALALMDRGLIRFSGYKKHQSTRITEDGRKVLAWLLASYAEALVKAGFTGLESPLHLALPNDELEIAALQVSRETGVHHEAGSEGAAGSSVAGAQGAAGEAIPASSPISTRVRESRSAVGGRQATQTSPAIAR